MDIVHLTTVHSRTDVRIFLKQVTSLARVYRGKVALVVADGKSDVTGDIPIHDLGAATGSRLGRAVLGSLCAFRFVFNHKPRIVHFHDPELIPLAMLLKLCGYKVIYDVHEDVPRQILSKHWIPWYFRRPVALAVSAVEWIAVRLFDAVVPATPKIAERFPHHKTTIVQNFPIKDELISASVTPYASREKTFVYIGGIARIRGAVEMVNALDCLKCVSAARLLLAGGFDPASLEPELRSLPGWEKVEYQGFLGRKEVAALLGSVRAGLVVLHPTANYLEAYPVKMFEYMAAGLPVIASDFPLWREIVDGAHCGILVDPLNPESIAQALQWILDNPVEAEAMGQRGQAAIRDIYNWDIESRKLLAVYEKLTDGELQASAQ